MSTRKSHITAGRLVVAAIAAATVFLAAAPASAASLIYYRVTGVLDVGGSNSGIATSFICTNLAATEQTVQVAVYAGNGLLAASEAVNMASRTTVNFSTHATMALNDDVVLSTGGVSQGYATIASTNSALLCTAMMLDAGVSAPNGIALHMQRIYPLTQTQE